MPYPPIYPGQDYPGDPLQLESIPSEESFSGTLNPARYIVLQSILSAESIGGVNASTTINLTSIPTGQSIGGISGLSRYYDLSPVPSGESFGIMAGSAGYVPPEIPISRPVTPLSVAERFSGVILNQNAVSDDETPLSFDDDYNLYQEFFLPRDFQRGKNTSDARVPPLTGFQVLVKVDEGYADVATLDWTIERYQLGNDWQELASGTAIGVNRSGNKVWFTVYAKDPIEVNETWLTDRFRIGLRGRDTAENEFKQIVPYESGQVTINSVPHDVLLAPGVPYHFVHEGSPSVLHLDVTSGKVYFSTERGVASVWTTEPNPLATASVKAYESDGVTPLQVDEHDTSINFRVLAGIAEEGTDFLGNRFRSVVTKTGVDLVTTLDSAVKDQYWLSKPNPSKFGVEAMYFDISDYQDKPTTVDHVLLDPVLPGVFFNVYHSDEGDPGTNELEWSDKLWTRVPNTFQAKGRFRHPMPQPITARYLKVEFTHLQPRWYGPGNFQKPILYNKHPKWVLDYFMLRIEAERTTEDPFIARRIGVTFDALDLAYNYYLDDLDQDPLGPDELGARNLDELQRFLSVRTDQSDLIDGQTRARLRATFQPYVDHPGAQGKLDYLLSTYALGSTAIMKSGERVLYPDYSTERLFEQSGMTNLVSSINREKLVVENNMPIMYFFIPSRHRYRQVTATLDNDKAYFAGVKEIAFQRDRYTVAHDTPLYIESAGDNINVERNDFAQVGTRWETHES